MADKLTNKEPKPKSPKQTPRRMSDVATARADLPDFIKAEELQAQYPFTIFGASPSKGRFGDRIRFDVAYKQGDEVIKKVLTLSANDERNDLMYEVRRHGAIVGCRLVEIQLGGGQTYWKIIDADAALPETVIMDESVRDEEIPFA